MDSSRYKISFPIKHPAMDPDEITSNLDLQPDGCWKAGAPRTTPHGRSLGGVRRETYWFARMGEGTMPPSSLSETLDTALDRLLPHRIFLAKIVADGGCLEFFVGWFFASQGGETFPYRLMAKMSDLHIDLALDNYCDLEHPEEDTQRPA